MEQRPSERPAHGYVHALGFDFLTPLYDPLLRALLREDALKGRLVAQAGILPGHAVLDVGCGTGTLAILAKRAHPDARIVGLDGDPKVLAIARRKIAAAKLDVELVEAMAFDPSLPAASFDRVLTSLVLHHLSRDEKRRTLAAVARLLRPGGELHIADFGPPRGRYARLASRLVCRFDGEDRVSDNLEGRLPELLAEAGFREIAETGTAWTPFGTLAYLRATAPLPR